MACRLIVPQGKMVVLPLWQDYHFFIQKLPRRVGTAYPVVMYSGRKIASTNPMNVQIANFESQKSSPAPKSRNPALIVLSSCMALQMTSFVIILPLFARRFTELGAGVEALGISEMAYALTSALAAPFMGALADRIGRRPIVLISLVAYAVVFCGYLIAPSVGVFIVLRGLAGAFTAGLNPAVTGLAADLAPRERRTQWISFVSGGASFGWIAGPITGGMIFDRWGYAAALYISIGMAVLAFLVAFLALPESRLATARSFQGAEGGVKENPPKNIKVFLLNLRGSLPKSLSSFIVLVFISFATLFAWAFIEPRTMFYTYNELGWSSSMLGFMMSTYGVALTLGELTLGRLSDRLGRKPIILIGLMLFSAQFLGLAFFRNHLQIAAAFVIAGLGSALFNPALSASFLDISPVEHRARILGIQSMVGSCGNILGPALVALFSSAVSARNIFLVSVGVVLLAILILLADQARERTIKKVSVGIPAA